MRSLLLGVGLLLCAGLYGCPVSDLDGDGVKRVVCLGDSNTDASWQTTWYPATPWSGGWCEKLPVLLGPGWQVINRGLAGSGATDLGRNPQGVSLYGKVALDAALATDHPDAVVLAWGTNDIGHNVPTDTIVAALEDEAADANGQHVLAYFATVPPLYPPYLFGVYTDHTADIAALNSALVARHSGMVIDFAANMPIADYYPDGAHLEDAGEATRAAVAYAVLH